jgi:uncharacterized membrane protein YccC
MSDGRTENIRKKWNGVDKDKLTALDISQLFADIEAKEREIEKIRETGIRRIEIRDEENKRLREALDEIANFNSPEAAAKHLQKIAQKAVSE